MEDLIKLVTEKVGLAGDQAGTAVSSVLGFLKGQLPEDMAGQFTKALGGLDITQGMGSLDDVVKKTGLSLDQVGSVVQTVLGFLKDKLPAPLMEQFQGLMGGGGLLAGIAKKLGGLFGGKS
jgi:hypothetical protein